MTVFDGLRIRDDRADGTPYVTFRECCRRRFLGDPFHGVNEFLDAHTREC